MAGNYYYLITSLPELSLQDKSLDFTGVSFREHIIEFLTDADLETIRPLDYVYDIRNLAGLAGGGRYEHDERGFYSEEDLKAGLTAPEMLPSFMEAFIYETNKHRDSTGYKELLNDLTARFIAWARDLENPFLKMWFDFDHNLRNILAGLNCRKFEYDIENEVLGGHFEARKIIRNKDRDFGLEKVIDYVETAVANFHESDIALREAAIDQMRWDYIESLEEAHHFDLENVMAYALKIRLIERNLKGNSESGRLQLDHMLKSIVKGYGLPAQFH